MDNKLIAKTLLTVYPTLLDYEVTLGERAQNHALCSFHAPLLTERIIDKIINLNVQQHTVHNLRLSLQRLLDRLPATEQKVVRSYYRAFEPATNSKRRAERLGLAERTYFRKLSTATNFVAAHLPQLGINFFTWQYLLQNLPWLRQAYRRLFQPHQATGKSAGVKRHQVVKLFPNPDIVDR